MKNELSKVYSPTEVEDKWYKYWEDNKLFHAEPDPSKKPYTIAIPPPNITGMLTMGHVLNNTLQDIFIRWKRMQGYNACWVPGIDHASIATEGKVTESLSKKGINKRDISREEFLEHCWEWKEEYGGIIIKQLRKLGVSCDWDRLCFTMDKEYYALVQESFVHLYNKGLIYKGLRLVNWCPKTQTAISDEEVIHQEENSKLWYFKYPVKDSSDFIVVATTRPETMLGDTGVAVNQHDERYQHLVGKFLILPLVGREIPVIADYKVEKEFGTGAVKVTPAHDKTDYEIGKRHNLQILNIMNPDASLNEEVPEVFRGLDRYKARKLVVQMMEEQGYLVKIEDYKTKIGYSQRGNVPIEPYLSMQWFMKMEDLAKPAIEAVKKDLIRFYPERWTKIYFNWMENIQDWCISRQLWWGHRIPVWYNNTTNEIYCRMEPPADSENWHQDEDVLDTWASSWLWAHGIFKNEKDLNYFYPTDTLITAPDIIFFWVARMIIAGYEFMGDLPFKDVYFTSIIRDEKGRKMSKSLGNSPDPLKVISDYGADALRFTIIYLSPLGQDVLFSESKCELGRNFANKIWNAGRFLLMNAESLRIDYSLIDKHKDITDRWILSRLNSTIKEFNTALETFNVNDSTKIIYNFIWSDFCDWYLELVKNRLFSETDSEVKSAVISRAVNIYENALKLLHPVMPYLTEEIWQSLSERKPTESVSTQSFPVCLEELIDSIAENEMEKLQSIIIGIRNIRSGMNIPPSKGCDVLIKTPDENLIGLIENNSLYIKKLTKADNILSGREVSRPKNSSVFISRYCEIYVPLEGLIDFEVEKTRLTKEKERLEKLIEGVQKKLSNESFVSRAPENIITTEKEKLNNFTGSLNKVIESLNLLTD